MAIFALVGYYTRRVPNRRMYIMAAVCVPALIGFLGMALLPNTPALKWTKWGMWMLTNIFSIALFFGWSMSTSPHPSKPRIPLN
jgi:MFS family permease